ncbi:protein shank-like isoform X2 [Paramacrobiotus metropolitanus]|uniref:protein shank-like isoform X2 n=1 Tax=Paramacrobiotus metropolitanus TaxID=2943436 RepID=UPI00244577F7|nr:protein shank-like isoform X2 [Paramacrobiotus metropolitanus]
MDNHSLSPSEFGSPDDYPPLANPMDKIYMHTPRSNRVHLAYVGSSVVIIFANKCLQFPPTTPIWEVKQKLFATLPKELKDSFNYGLFCPPYNGRAGKFLDDERMLQDYPMPGHVGYLELKYKRRVYKMMNLDEKVLKQLHSKANLRKFIDYVLTGQSDKICRLCEKGLDPNFHDLDSGETPLTIAAALTEPAPVLAALVNGGAHLDFRALDGCTALHRAAQRDNFKALQGLLDLGSSANYKDAKGLTPLYYSVTHAKDPNLCEKLLHNYAILGTVDSQGWEEIHQACRYGHVRHLEHLIFYGADIDARNASGNTPLHTAAVNNQESCARVLLFRGADKYAKNYANQTAYQVAVIAQAIELAEVIKRHSSKDVVPLREKPSFNPRRRRRSCSPNSTLSRASSVNRLGSRSPSLRNGPLASPSPSMRSSCLMFSTTGSVSSNGSNCENSHPSEADFSSSGVVTDKSSCSDESTCTPMNRPPIATTQRSRAHHPSVCSEQIHTLSRSSSQAFSVKSVPTMRADSAFSSDSMPFSSRDPSPSERGLMGVPRTVTLMRGGHGYGFVLRGSKSGHMSINRDINVAMSDNPPALQYLDEVDRGGPADLAGLKAGDYLLTINSEDVRTYPHEKAVSLIRQAQHTVTLTVLTPPRIPSRAGSGSSKSTLVTSKFRKNDSRMAIPPPPRRDPRTALTIGPERARSYVGLNDIGAANHDTMTSESAKIASIRARPLSKRITASEIEELLVRQGAGAGGGSGSAASSTGRSSPAPNLSSFAPLPLNDRPDTVRHLPTSASSSSAASTSSRVFTSVAHMKRQRAALQQQRRKTDVVSTASLHKDYHSTPDLSAEGAPDGLETGAGGHNNDDTEELYSDTVFHAHHHHPVAANYHTLNKVPDSPQQLPHHNGYRSVPTTPSEHSAYARPIIANHNTASAKPPLPPNRPPSHAAAVHHPPPAQQQHTLNRSTDRASSQPRFVLTSMKPSQSLDERAYAQVRYYNAPPTAAPEDPEPDYFSDEDRLSFASSGRSTSTVATAKPTPMHATKVVPATGARMMANPPPPPPPPVVTTGGQTSFAAAIAKAAQARQAKADAQGGGQPTPSAVPLKPVQPVAAAAAAASTPVGTATPKLDGFQSELMRAIQRRSQDRDSESRRSSTDVDAVNTKDDTANNAAASSVKDRISFLERQTVSGPRSVRITGITNDQSSTDNVPDAGDVRSGTDVSYGRNAAAVTSPMNVSIRAGKPDTCHTVGALLVGDASSGYSEIDEGTATRFGVFRTTGVNTYLRDHDSASINSQSSASTLSSGYESPTLKYGSTGEHLWTDHHHVLRPVYGNKFSPSIDILPELVPVPPLDFNPTLDYESNGVSIAPPPEFS